MQEDEQGFTVRDRRIDHEAAGEPEPQAAPAPQKEAVGEAAAQAADRPAEPSPGAASQAAAAGSAGVSPEASADAAAEAAKAGFSMAGEGPAIDFSAFVFSLARTALIHLGLENHPETGQPEANLQAARETIDVLGMLEDKTRGNLTPEESELIAKLLYTLRVSFVEVSRAGHSG